MMIKKTCQACKRLAWHNQSGKDAEILRCTVCGHPPRTSGASAGHERIVHQIQLKRNT